MELKLFLEKDMTTVVVLCRDRLEGKSKNDIICVVEEPTKC